MASATVVNFDTLDPELLFHDFDLFKQVREAGGICRTEAAAGMWVVGDFDLIQQAAADERFRSGDGVRFPRSGGPKVLALEYDRPKHTEHRKILTDAVGPRAAKGLEPTVRALADDPDNTDLPTGYSYPMPLDVLFSVIGAPDDVKEHASQLAEALFFYRRPMPDGSDPGVGIRKLIDELVAQKMAEPGGDWLSHVVTHRGEAGLELTDDEVHGAVTAMLGGGHHSTARGLACLLTEILHDPKLQAQLRANPKNIPAIAEESLHRHTPLRWFARTASEDVEIGGQTIQAGDHVYLLYGAGNLDPKQFANPDKIDPAERKNSEHLAFGWGMHRCVGMPLAQLEIRIAVAELLAATEDIQLTGEITWSAAVEPRNIPVRLIGFVPPGDE